MPASTTRTHLRLLKELSANSDEWEVIRQQIESAEASIYVSTFFIEPDRYGYDFLKLMSRAALRGVKCIVMTDYTGERLAGYMHRKPKDALLRKLWKEFEAAGGCHVMTRPSSAITNSLSRFVMGGNHFKFMIFDRMRALITGRNIGTTSFDAWADYGILVEGSIVSDLLVSFGDLLTINRVRHSLEPHPESHDRSGSGQAAGEEVLFIDFDPIHHGGYLNPFARKTPNAITEFLRHAILQARSEILISSFMFKPAAVLLDAVLTASRKGVKVRLVTSGVNALPRGRIAYWAAACGYEELKTAGVEIYETLVPEHSKLVVIDGSWAGFGSYNFEFAAHDRFREGMVMSQNPRFVERIRAILVAKCDVRVSRRVSEEAGGWKTQLGYSMMRPVRWFC